MGTKQTILEAGSLYKRLHLEKGSVFCVCCYMAMCEGLDVGLWVQLTLKPDSSCPVSVSARPLQGESQSRETSAFFQHH